MKKNKLKNEVAGFGKGFISFISRGNIIDLAIAVIIGAAFGKIVTSFVNDIIMPLFAALLGESHFTNLSFNVGEAVIYYGRFIQYIFEFLVISFAIYLTIEYVMGRKRKREKEAREKALETPKVEEPSKTEVLLQEIRDLLKKENEGEIKE